METYDILQTEMQVIQQVFKENQVKMLKDKKITKLLNFLHIPKTYEEIKKFYQKEYFENSSINLTKILADLIEAGLIIEVGRRISRDKKQNLCINKLFTRSACIFNIRINRKPITFCSEELLFLEKVLYLGKDNTSNSRLFEITEQMIQIVNQRNKIFDDLVLQSNNILNPQEKNTDWNRIYTLLDLSSWLILFKNNKELLEGLYTLYD